ncbi:hypothetical protein Y032_0244g3522 [Ancylostoma ceylanicum]|uniref:Uncharacterized protein n=1 Tax=Ancylostoma ceylanicum TaxID=53326 RepID=A0A016SE98_9BILA|nr:hypothetical protein Y032_0244g3522 [Ancylostoma ceylanicum]
MRRGHLLTAFQRPTMININETHPGRLPTSIIDGRSTDRPLERHQQGPTPHGMRCGCRPPRNIHTIQTFTFIYTEKFFS